MKRFVKSWKIFTASNFRTILNWFQMVEGFGYLLNHSQYMSEVRVGLDRRLFFMYSV
jgi:hypothetical protein